METFLKQIAQLIVDSHPTDTDEVLVVFNNNRSKRFFTKQFDTLGRATFLPKVMTIDEFISELGGLEIVPNEFLLFELYHIHVKLCGEERKYQTFDEFISFGDLMMGDFSEIDQYMVDARQIFDNLHSLKAIGEWDIEGGGQTDFQRKYLAFYRSLYDYYSQLHQTLLAQGKAYGGMAYREVAEHIDEWDVENGKWKAVYFVGFNALSKCEEKIIGEYVRRGIGHLLADSDIYYLEPHQEAGYFLEKHLEDFPELRPTGPSLFETCKKKITLVDCPENILQCKYTGQLLSEHLDWLSPEEAESTAVVLADEKLLIPTLNALPDTEKSYNINITMGYDYSDSMVHALVARLFSLFRQHNSHGYYHRDVIEVLSDRFICQLAGVGNLRHTAEDFLRRDNRIRCHGEELLTLLKEAGATDAEGLLFLFPSEKPTPEECLALLQQLAEKLADSEGLEHNLKERQALGCLKEILDNLGDLQRSYPYIQDLDTLEKIYSRIAQRHAISLIGEPLTGLQILGMLETRNLDFRRVILLSANEGVLPAGRGGNTLIPHELKVHFGLPTYVEKDSVYAYHFYHLLQRAEEVYLIYSSETDGLGKGEPSRFLRQVEGELAPRFGITVNRIVVKADASLTETRAVDAVEKDEATMQRLAEMGRNGLSPTSFSDFLECPLKYYYSRVLRISERDNIDEDLDAAQLGDSVHKVLENILQPHLGAPLTLPILEEALAHLKEQMDQVFEELYRHGRSAEGRNSFLYSVAETQLRHILENEIRLIKEGHRLTVLAVEENIQGYAITPEVHIKGKVDRVDRLDDTLRIVDYKTGGLTDKEIAYSDDDESIPGKWLQLMWYALLYTRTHRSSLTTPHSSLLTHHSSLKSGIYPLRNLRSDVKMASWNGHEDLTPECIDHFEELLREHVNELMNPALPFIPTPSKKGCRFCPAASFCRQSI
jgi:hypothetical protein